MRSDRESNADDKAIKPRGSETLPGLSLPQFRPSSQKVILFSDLESRSRFRIDLCGAWRRPQKKRDEDQALVNDPAARLGNEPDASVMLKGPLRERREGGRERGRRSERSIGRGRGSDDRGRAEERD